MIPIKLIEKALKLTGKKMNDMNIQSWEYNEGDIYKGKHFSIEKFCYYLMSPEFIEKYFEYDKYDLMNNKEITIARFGNAIYSYQSGDEQPLIYLLSKIK